MLDFFYMLKGGVENEKNSDSAIEWVLCRALRDYKDNPEVISEALALIKRHRRRLSKALVRRTMEAWVKEQYSVEPSLLQSDPNMNWMGVIVTNPIQ